ncbi:hypothetical protein [Streptomyces sp. NPDC092952]|uniref:hypothetical protein n=1 Tax=Streptomyces sp. NPDC092952 TaxID=3366018 RepID=UPI0037F59CD9
MPSAGTTGDHLALVHSASFGDVALHVNGVESARLPWVNTWDLSTTALRVGRTLNGDISSAWEASSS